VQKYKTTPIFNSDKRKFARGE